MSNRLSELMRTSLTPAKVRIDAKTGAVRWIRGQFPAQTGSGSAQAVVRTFLTKHAKGLKLPSKVTAWEATSDKGKDGVTQVVIRQRHRDVPVFGAGLVIEVAKNRSIQAVSINLAFGSEGSLKPRLNQKQAAAIVRARLGVGKSFPLKGELVIHDPAFMLGLSGKAALNWCFSLKAKGHTQVIMVDDSQGVTTMNTFLPFDFQGVFTALHPFAQYHLNERTGVPDFITFGPTGLALAKLETDDPAEAAFEFFSQQPRWFGTNHPDRQLRLAGVQNKIAKTRMAHVTFQQIYGDIPVYGAELRVHLDASLNISSVSGNFVREPFVIPEPKVKQERARNEAIAFVTACRLSHIDRTKDKKSAKKYTLATWLTAARKAGRVTTKSKVKQALNEVAGQVEDAELVILPSTLSDLANARNRLTWRFRFPEADLFVDARTAKIVFSVSNLHSAVRREIYEAEGLYWAVPGQLVLVDGVAQPGPAPSGNATSADTLIQATLNFYSWLGRSNFDGEPNGVVRAITNTEFDANPFSVQTNAMWDETRELIGFSWNFVVDDIVAHEFTHGVVSHTAKLVYQDESGALNEHYADTMGNLCFPDPQWLIGGRDMQDPANAADPVHYSQFRGRSFADSRCANTVDSDFFANKCDNGNVHSNSGIGNRAAALLSDGSWTPPVPPTTNTPATTPGHAGIGRDRLAKLFFETLTTRMHPWSRYLDELHNTWQTARDLEGSDFPGRDPASSRIDFTAAVRDEVVWAFNQVGVDTRLVAGYFRVAGAGDGDVPFNEGELPVGFQVTDVILHLRSYHPNGDLMWSDTARATDGDGGRVDFPGGIFGASIMAQDVGSRNRTATIHWFSQGFDSNFDFNPVFQHAAVGAAAGTTPPPLEDTAVFYESKSHSPDPSFNNSGTDVIREGRTLEGANCRITSVTLELTDEDGQTIATHRFGDSGQAISPGSSPKYGAHIEAANLDTADQTVRVNWWLEPPCTCYYRVEYQYTPGCQPG